MYSGHRIGVTVGHKKRSAQFNNFGSQIGQQQEHICEDKRGDCVANKKLCYENSAHAEWMNTNCQRTCGKCNNKTSLSPERYEVKWQNSICIEKMLLKNETRCRLPIPFAPRQIQWNFVVENKVWPIRK